MPEKILITDDDLDTLRLVSLMLKKLGYDVVSANSGPKALELVKAESPDLVILDVMMPGMDGLEVARQLKANEATQNIPILMFSAKGELNDKVAGFEAGGDDYLTKPTHPSDLQAHIKALLARFSSEKTVAPRKPAVSKSYLVGIISARGGQGVTTVAANLASMLGARVDGNVALVEFRPGQGTLHYDLGIEKPTGLTELLHKPAPEITLEAVTERLTPHADGFKILAASSNPRDAALQQNIPQFVATMNALRALGSYVVVDLGCGLNQLNQRIVQMFNEVIIVVEPYEHTLQHAQLLVEDLGSLGVERDNLFLVVNYRQRSDTPLLSVVQIQSYFRAPIEVSLTPAPDLYLQASRKNSVACRVSQESVTALQFKTLAQKIEARIHQPAGL